MSSPQKETPEQKVARLAKGSDVRTYKGHCDTIKDNENLPAVKRYCAATKTYDVTKDKDEVKKFISARGGKASKKDLDKLREANEDIRDFESAEKVKNELAQESHVTKHRNATNAKKSMEEKNAEVIAYHSAKRSAHATKEIRKAAKLLLQPSSSSTGSTQNPSNAGDGNGTQIIPLVGKPDDDRVLGTRLRNEERQRRQFEEATTPAATPAGDSSKKTSRDRPRHRSRNRPNPPTGSKPPASAPEEPQRNSGRHRRSSPHTDMERNFDFYVTEEKNRAEKEARDIERARR
ncbi:hypothetical protein BGAL_0854g00010 [Botrytis galanthina]|uniref:Uncharacterized protein n=1 Tax=Botrytis galanthina TaxID=278940 RepID=A0A4S8QH85_9HELO|nr:hypothetical protein BGAL_0854g00010 [Botrytis galanthina]